MKHILYCNNCKKFTLREKCLCSSKTVPLKPAKYSPQSKYAKYRLQAKREQLEQQGLL